MFYIRVLSKILYIYIQVFNHLMFANMSISSLLFDELTYKVGLSSSNSCVRLIWRFHLHLFYDNLLLFIMYPNLLTVDIRAQSARSRLVYLIFQTCPFWFTKFPKIFVTLKTMFKLLFQLDENARCARGYLL